MQADYGAAPSPRLIPINGFCALLVALLLWSGRNKGQWVSGFDVEESKGRCAEETRNRSLVTLL